MNSLDFLTISFRGILDFFKEFFHRHSICNRTFCKIIFFQELLCLKSCFFFQFLSRIYWFLDEFLKDLMLKNRRFFLQCFFSRIVDLKKVFFKDLKLLLWTSLTRNVDFLRIFYEGPPDLKLYFLLIYLFFIFFPP